MLIKAEVEIEIDDEVLQEWVEKTGADSPSDFVSEIEGMEGTDEVCGVSFMMRFSSARES